MCCSNVLRSVPLGVACIVMVAGSALADDFAEFDGRNRLIGDANNDGDVDVFQLDGGGDAQVLCSNLGMPSGASWSDGDFNLDGDVDVFQLDGKGDAQLLSSNLGATRSPEVTEMVVPEPSSLLVWSLLGMLVLIHGWRRRKAA